MTDPVAGLDDFQGKKVRCVGWSFDYSAELGASPVPTPFGEMYSALATGVLDGAFTPWDAMLGFKLYEQAPYLLLPTVVGAPGLNVFISQDSWDALSDDLKTIVQ